MKTAWVAVTILVGGVAWGQEKPAAGERQVTMAAVSKPLKEVMMTVGKGAKVSFMVDPSAQVDGKPASEALVTAKANAAPAIKVIRDAVGPMWMEAEEVDGLVFVTDNTGAEDLVRWRGMAGAVAKAGLKAVMDPNVPKEMLAKLTTAKVNMEGSEGLRKATEAMAKAAGFKVKYDIKYRELGDGPVTVFGAHELPLVSWLNWAARADGLAWTVEGDTIVITDRVGMEGRGFGMERQLKSTVVSFDFKNKPAREVTDYLMMKASVNVVIPYPGKTVMLKMDNVTVEAALKAIGAQLNLMPIFMGGGVVMCDRGEAVRILSRGANVNAAWIFVGRATPADLQTLEKVRKTMVTFTFEKMPMKEAFTKVGEMGKVEVVVVPPKGNAGRFPVTLKLTDVSMELALRLICNQNGMKCTIMGGKVVVSDEAGIRGAKK